jgi:hypothetical protein
MKIEKYKLRGNNSVCAVSFQLLRCRPPAHVRGNINPRAVQLVASLYTDCAIPAHRTL